MFISKIQAPFSPKPRYKDTSYAEGHIEIHRSPMTPAIFVAQCKERKALSQTKEI